MKKLAVVLTVLAILVVGLGFYRGWFALSRPASDAGSNKVNINLATDTDKMKQDAEMVSNKATELTGGVTDDVKADGQANDNVKSNDF
jgi:anionic cell wall polymer biosynthesis LytR-Cps2A-Psr (LCP) family protein